MTVSIWPVSKWGIRIFFIKVCWFAHYCYACMSMNGTSLTIVTGSYSILPTGLFITSQRIPHPINQNNPLFNPSFF